MLPWNTKGRLMSSPVKISWNRVGETSIPISLMQYTNKKRLNIQEIEINDEIASSLFLECNRLFFDNKIPEIPIEIIDSDTLNGDLKYDVDLDKKSISNYKIQISKSRKRTKKAFISTMVHEMLHYEVVSEITKDQIDQAAWYYQEGDMDKFDKLLYNNKYAHTGLWAEKADNINKLYGIKINKA